MAFVDFSSPGAKIFLGKVPGATPLCFNRLFQSHVASFLGNSMEKTENNLEKYINRVDIIFSSFAFFL